MGVTVRPVTQFFLRQDGRSHFARPGGVGPRAQQDAQVPLQRLRGHQEDRADHSCRDEARVDSPRRGEVKLWQGAEESHQGDVALEYEVDELQTKFAESIGTMDLDNLDVDFIEDMMLKAKPLQSVLN